MSRRNRSRLDYGVGKARLLLTRRPEVLFEKWALFHGRRLDSPRKEYSRL